MKSDEREAQATNPSVTAPEEPAPPADVSEQPAVPSIADKIRGPDGKPYRTFPTGPIDIRSISLTGLFVLAVFYTLYLASDIILPFVLATILAIILSPLVRFMRRRLRIPPTIGAALVLIAFLMISLAGLWRLSGPATGYIENWPETARTVEYRLRDLRRPMEAVTEAAQRAEELTEVDNEGDRTQTVRVKEATIASIVVNRTQEFIIGAAVTVALLFFLLASDDLFLRKLVLVMPRLADKKRAVEIVHSIQSDISNYLLTITVINLGLGAATGFAMYLLGMPNPILWGVMAAAFNFIPYLGAILGIGIVGIVALVTFDNLATPGLVMGTYFLITAMEANIVTPLVLGRRLTLNPFVVFAGLILWGWLWGIPGALLAVPLLAAFKIVCDRLSPLNPIGEFMGR